MSLSPTMTDATERVSPGPVRQDAQTERRSPMQPVNDDANDSVEIKEAMQYWGDMFQDNRMASEKLERLLLGIARYISMNIHPSDCQDLTPDQLAAFYRKVGGNYDVLFVDAQQSISFIYKSIGCLHSLQPPPMCEGFSVPNIPALKPRGFVKWQTIQLLLGPEEHVPFLQSAVKDLGIVDPVDGMPFPSVLPKECFPDKPDERMLRWYEGVSEKLKREAAREIEASRQQNGNGRPPVIHHPFSDAPRPPSVVSSASSTDDELRSSHETAAAAARFARPTFDKTRPGMDREGSRIAYNVRHVAGNPRPRNIVRDPAPGRRYDDTPSSSDDEAVAMDGPTPTQLHPRYQPRSPLSKSARADSFTSTDEDDYPRQRDQDRRRSPQRIPSRSPRRISEYETGRPRSPTSRKVRPELRSRRSHDHPSSPGDYFDPRFEGVRRHSLQPGHRQESNGGFGPSKDKIFASQVAAAQARGNYATSPTSRLKESQHDYLRPSSGRYGSDNSLSRREKERERDRDRDRPGYGKSRSDERMERESKARRSSGSQSDDRYRDRDWNGERDRDRDRERDRSGRDDSSRSRERLGERDRERRGHRYVTPVDGVGGRRYPLEQTWR